MIVRILSRGTSFEGLAAYLTHDPEAKTADRVGWTHTLNLANDHVPSAVDEMLWTARDAELLKQEAGIRAGGRATEHVVKHLSLNWAPDENPTRDHMIETTEDFLRHMNWQQHQALLVAHEDKEHAHVHVMLNVIDPETGLRLDDNFERRRAQAWALDYEKEQGHVYCEQRLKNPEEREKSLPRDAWMAFQENQKSFERDENQLRLQAPILVENPENSDRPKNPYDDEWKILKEMQQRERREFFAEGKAEFSDLRRAVYREVREEFRERWGDFYAMQKDGADAEELARLKAELVADQKELLEARRDEACQQLRETRAGIYRDLLDEQREMRHGLRARQEEGLDNALFLQLAADKIAERDWTSAKDEITAPASARSDDARREEVGESTFEQRHERGGMRSGADVGSNIGTGIGFGIISLFESIADGLIGAKPDPKPQFSEPEHERPDPFEIASNEARQRQQREQEDGDEEWRKRQRSLERD